MWRGWLRMRCGSAKQTASVTDKGGKGRAASLSDVNLHVETLDLAYHLAAAEYDSGRMTMTRELKLLRARAALRLACSVHVKVTSQRG